MPAAHRRLAFPRALALVFAAVLALLPAAAHAEDSQRAREFFQQGTTYFNLGDFDKAIEAFQEAYKAKPDPLVLYNIGQAYRLKGDPAKAIFFYRGYLRNSPKAQNRAEIEAKIAALQKEVSEPKAPPPTAPAPVTPAPVAPAPVAPSPTPAPVAPSPPPPPGPAPVAPLPVAAPPLAGPSAGPEAPEPTAEAPPAVPPPPLANRPIDIWLGVGIVRWTSGFNIKGSAPTQFGLNLGAGYTFGDVYGAASFRLGALFATTSQSEGAGTTANTLSFTSLLVEPSLRVRLIDRRLYLAGALGVGDLLVSGVRTTSVVVDPKVAMMSPPPKITNPISSFEVRPAIGLEVQISPALVAFVAPAIVVGAKPANFYQSLGRFELMFGASYLF
jgi:hypothetical protein